MIRLFALPLMLAGLFVSPVTPAADPLYIDNAWQMPELARPDLSGQTRSLSDWRGKVIVLNFWATWCPPCRKEIPIFIDFQTRLGSRGLQIVGIAIDDLDNVRSFSAETGINYPLLIGAGEAFELVRTLGNRIGGLPFTVVVDRGGEVRHTHAGELDAATLQALIDPLL